MLNINNGFHWCIVNFCMKQSWLNEMGPRAGRAQLQCAPPRRCLPGSLALYVSLLRRELPWWLWCCCLNGGGWSLAEALGCGRHCYLPVHGPALGPADSQLLRGMWRQQLQQQQQQQPRDQSELGECPQFSGQSGRRVVVKRGEKREGGTSGRWCKELSVLREVFTVSVHAYM